MLKANINDMVRGWFVGNFEPSLHKTDDVEVGLKNYKIGDYEESHYHKIATEITVIVSGKAEMNKIVYTPGDIIVIEPNEKTDFKALEDTKAMVVKIPGVLNDKYIKEEE